VCIIVLTGKEKNEMMNDNQLKVSYGAEYSPVFNEDIERLLIRWGYERVGSGINSEGNCLLFEYVGNVPLAAHEGYYAGKPIEEMSHRELVDALRDISAFEQRSKGQLMDFVDIYLGNG